MTLGLVGTNYKVKDDGTPLAGSVWWVGGGPMYYIPSGSGVGAQLMAETGQEDPIDMDLELFMDRDAVFGHVGTIPWL